MRSYILFAFILFLGSCATKKTTKVDDTSTKETHEMTAAKDSELLLTFKKGPCFGKCPVFQMDVYTDGRLDLTAKKFMKKEGTFIRQLSQDEYTRLVGLIDDAKLYEKEDKYDELVMDASVTEYIYYGDQGIKSMSYKIKIPQGVDELTNVLQELAMSSDGWHEYVKDDFKAENAKDTQLIIYLDKSFDINKWSENYKHLGLEVNRVMSPNGGIYLFDFDQSFHVQRVMEELRRDKAVIKVEANTKSTNKSNDSSKVKVRKATKVNK